MDADIIHSKAKTIREKFKTTDAGPTDAGSKAPTHSTSADPHHAAATTAPFTANKDWLELFKMHFSLYNVRMTG